MPRLAAAFAVLTCLALAACDAYSSSGAAGAAASTSTPSPSGTADPRSRALCTAVTNALGSGPDWALERALPASRQVAGVAVPSCE